MTNRHILLFAIFLLVYSLTAQAGIFGNDDRSQVTPNSPRAKLGSATAVGVLRSMSEKNQYGRIDLKVDYLEDVLCNDQKFNKDPSISYGCTGFLVGPDLLMTAGHCATRVGGDGASEVRDEAGEYCDVYDWLFDFQTSSSGKVMVKDIDSKLYYTCEKIIYAVLEVKPPFRDFALIKLNRKVLDREPLKVSREKELRLGEPVYMIGYPLAMPMKLADNARVLLNNSARQSLVTNLDTLDGNSGSPVFSTDDLVAGILTNGSPSITLVDPDQRGCKRYNRCSDSGANCLVPDKDTSVLPGFQQTGSDVQKIGPILEKLKSIGIVLP